MLSFGFYCNKKQRIRWAAILGGWNEAIVRYCQIHDGDDVPYHYNERANICLLASGALLSGATVLEEFRSNKGQASSPLRGGRTDLYISTQIWNAEIEAKQKYLNFTLDPSRIKAIRNGTLGLAEKDVQAASRDGTNFRYACAFFPLWAPKGSEPTKKDIRASQIATVVTSIIETSSADLWAWSCPPIASDFMDEEEDKSHSYYPGIILGLREVTA